MSEDKDLTPEEVEALRKIAERDSVLVEVKDGKSIIREDVN